jgi:cytochrome c oxidase subunit II
MIRSLVEQASSYAAYIDGLFLLVLVFVGFWFLVAEGMFFWLILKFRAKPGVKSQYITGKEKHLKRWITVPHAIIIGLDVIIVAGSIWVWNHVKINRPEADATVRIIGQQWAWVFQHPGPDNILDTADDIWTVDDLFVQNDRTYHFELESRDVLHNFSVPVFRLKQDAIPGRRISGWFNPTRSGSYDIQCAEICGIGHGVMFGRIHVQEAAEHAEWLAANTPVEALTVASAAPVDPDADAVSAAGSP